MKKILVVDDDESILDAISLLLEDAGYTVEVLLKAQQTLKKVLAYRPSVILLDVLMSGEDGREICKKLKRNKETHSIPVIMISAHPTAKESVIASGADDFLPKPFNARDLLEMLEKHVLKDHIDN